MIALLTLLGLGAFVGILAGGSDGDDGDAVSEADPDGGMPPLEAAPRVFDDGPQTLFLLLRARLQRSRKCFWTGLIFCRGR